MSNLENSIKDCITRELEKGIIERVITDKLEECIDNSLEDLFKWNGAVKKVIEEKVEGVMVPYLENYDYSAYITKLDDVLVHVLKNTAFDNKKILENFKELMVSKIDIKVIKVSDLFSKWCEYVAEEVDTQGLGVEYEDGPSYECVDVSYEFDQAEERNWVKRESGRILFECEHDEKLNFCIDVYRWNDIHEKDQWDFIYDKKCEISSLRHLDKFSLYLMSLSQAGVEIEIDRVYDNEEVRPEKEPEVYFE
ncbi:hypothetical protein ACQPUZ_10590 [Clostridium tertium]